MLASLISKVVPYLARKAYGLTNAKGTTHNVVITALTLGDRV